MSLGRSWKRVAKHRHRAVRTLEVEVERLNGRVVFWQTLSNASPRVEQERELDQVSLELKTLQTLLVGFRRDLDFLLDEGLASPAGLALLRRMRMRLGELCDG